MLDIGELNTFCSDYLGEKAEISKYRYRPHITYNQRYNTYITQIIIAKKYCLETKKCCLATREILLSDYCNSPRQEVL